MSVKPKILYHGSQYRFDVVKPRQANGQCEAEAQMGIYAAATMEEVIPLCTAVSVVSGFAGGKAFLRFGRDQKLPAVRFH